MGQRKSKCTVPPPEDLDSLIKSIPNSPEVRRKVRKERERWRASVEAHEELVATGDGRAVLEAMAQCVEFDTRPPAWLRAEFLNRLDDWASDQIETLDEAFGVQRPRGQHFKELKKRRAAHPYVAMMIIHLHMQGRPLDRALFAEVGKVFGFSASVTARLYYDKANARMRWMREILESDDVKKIIAQRMQERKNAKKP